MEATPSHELVICPIWEMLRTVRKDSWAGTLGSGLWGALAVIDDWSIRS